jgi:hypothetical protein
MNTCESKKAHFVDGFYDTLSSELDHARGHGFVLLVLVHDMFPMVFTLVLLLQPRRIFTFLFMVALCSRRELVL